MQYNTGLHILCFRLFLGCCFMFSPLLLQAQTLGTDNSPAYQSIKTGYAIQKITYTDQHVIIKLAITLPSTEKELVLFGPYTSETLYLADAGRPGRTFPLLALKNVYRGSTLEMASFARGESAYLPFRPGETFTCELYYGRLPDDVNAVRMTEGMAGRKVVFSSINVKPEYGKATEQTAAEENTSEDTDNEPSQSLTQERLAVLNDSLQQALKAGNTAEVARLYDKLAAVYMLNNDYDEAMKQYQKLLTFQQQQNNKKGIADAATSLGNTFFYLYDYDKALENYQLALKNAEVDAQQATLQNNIGTVYEEQAKYDLAIDAYEKALTTESKQSNKPAMAKLQYKIGNVYYVRENYQKSLQFYEQALSIDKERGKVDEQAASLNNIGVVHYQIENYQQAIDAHKEALKISREQNNAPAEAISLNNIGNVNYNWEKFTEALNYYDQSLKIKEDINNQRGIAISLYNIGNTYRKLNQNDKAKEYYDRSLKLARQLNFKKVEYSNYQAMAELEALTGNCQRPFSLYKQYISMRFALTSQESSQLSEMQVKYLVSSRQQAMATSRSLVEELEQLNRINELKSKELNTALSQIRQIRTINELQASKREKENQLLKKENALQEATNSKLKAEARRKTLMLWSVIVGLLLVAAFSAMLLRLNQQKRKANVLLSEQNEEIKQQAEEIRAQRDEIETQRDYVSQQHDKIKQQKDEITSSIEYASRIQNAILPPVSLVSQLLPDHFILYRPRDIVSGDFYWMSSQDDKLVVVVADCTGHGVPGAFMSVMGVSLLNDIVAKQENLKASSILEALRASLMQALHQTGRDGEAKDGMDMALCVLDLPNKHLQYAGAFNPLYHLQHEQLHIYKADKMPIGTGFYEQKSFTNHDITLQQNDIIYLFSDGYPDQFGGERGKKFLTKRFRQLLMDVHHLPMAEQKQQLDETLDKWMGAEEQVDDILVMGIRV